MRKLALLPILFCLSVYAFGQQTSPQTPLTQQDYLQKSKRQKTAAWVLLGAGAALVSAGLLIGDGGDETSFDQAASGGVIAGIGAVPVLCSIPFFLASSRNKQKAALITGGLQMNRSAWTANRQRPALVTGICKVQYWKTKSPP